MAAKKRQSRYAGPVNVYEPESSRDAVEVDARELGKTLIALADELGHATTSEAEQRSIEGQLRAVLHAYNGTVDLTQQRRLVKDALEKLPLIHGLPISAIPQYLLVSMVTNAIAHGLHVPNTKTLQSLVAKARMRTGASKRRNWKAIRALLDALRLSQNLKGDDTLRKAWEAL